MYGIDNLGKTHWEAMVILLCLLIATKHKYNTIWMQIYTMWIKYKYVYTILVNADTDLSPLTYDNVV